MQAHFLPNAPTETAVWMHFRRCNARLSKLALGSGFGSQIEQYCLRLVDHPLERFHFLHHPNGMDCHSTPSNVDNLYLIGLYDVQLCLQVLIKRPHNYTVFWKNETP